MNEMLELWSVPWHALQSRLADGIGFEAAATAAAAAVARQAAQPPAAAGYSWLARALGSAPAGAGPAVRPAR